MAYPGQNRRSPSYRSGINPISPAPSSSAQARKMSGAALRYFFPETRQCRLTLVDQCGDRCLPFARGCDNQPDDAGRVVELQTRETRPQEAVESPDDRGACKGCFISRFRPEHPHPGSGVRPCPKPSGQSRPRHRLDRSCHPRSCLARASASSAFRSSLLAARWALSCLSSVSRAVLLVGGFRLSPPPRKPSKSRSAMEVSAPRPARPRPPAESTGSRTRWRIGSSGDFSGSVQPFNISVWRSPGMLSAWVSSRSISGFSFSGAG